MNAQTVIAGAGDPPIKARPARLRVLVVTADAVLAGQLSRACAADDRTVLAGVAVDAHEAITAVQRVNIDLALIDLDMPVLTGIGAVQMISGLGRRIEVMALLSTVNLDSVVGAVQAGANSVLAKERQSPAEVVSALVSLCNGESVISPEVARYLIERFQLAH